jgi:hypothetical protein
MNAVRSTTGALVPTPIGHGAQPERAGLALVAGSEANTLR